MGLDYDEIRKGRRREWEKLRDPEERRAEEAAARRAKRKVVTRSMRLEAEREEDLRRWRRVRLQVGILVGAALAFAAASAGAALWRAAAHAARVDEGHARSAALADPAQRYHNLETPFDALATWRNAWMRGSAPDLVALNSTARRRRVQRGISDIEAARDLRERINRGGRLSEQAVATHFGRPQALQLPRNPRAGDLAVFASEPVPSPTAANERVRWVVAFVFEPETSTWRLEDYRQLDMWNERWARNTQIRPPRSTLNYNPSRF